MAATRHLVLFGLILGSVLASPTQGLRQGDSGVNGVPQIRREISEGLEDIVEELIEMLENRELESQDDRMVMADAATVSPDSPGGGMKKDEWSESSTRGIEDDDFDDLVDEDMRWCDSDEEFQGSALSLLKKEMFELREIIPGWNDKTLCDHHECFKDLKTWPKVPYYLLNDANYLITWPTRYLRVFYIFNYNFYNMMDKNITAVENYAQEAVSVLDKAYKPINFRVLLVGVNVLTGRWEGEEERPKYNEYLKPKVREYIWTTIKPEAPMFHTAVYIAGYPFWDAPYAGAGMGHLCKVLGMDNYPFVMAAEGNKRPANHYWNAHELGHEFRNGHNFDPSDDGSSICPAKRIFGTKCVMGGNSYPTTFSRTFLDKIRATNYTCMADKPPQEEVFRCGNGILDAGEECDCGNSQRCITSDPCCDGQICKLKQNAECSANNPCCNNCKVDLISCPDHVIGKVKRAADPIKSFNRIDFPPGVLVPFPGGTMTPPNRMFNWLFEAPAGSRVTLWLAIPPLASPSFETAVGCPYDWIEVRDGGYVNSPLVGRFCTPTTTPIVSKGTQLFVTFRSDNSFDSHFLLKYSFSSTALSGKRWRDDGKCGWKFPAPGAASGQCEPDGATPCCWSNGLCKGDTDCDCPGCVDYRKFNNEGMPKNPVKAMEVQTLDSECYEGTGEAYRGEAGITWSGTACQAWSSQTPHKHSFNPATYPNLGLDNNYCRNPDMSSRPWCYTTDPKKMRDNCIVSKCTGPAYRAEYVGCYKDKSTRTFPFARLRDYKSMTPAVCINHCSGLGYSYAAIQYYYECHCGTEANFAALEPVRPESECNFPCRGDKEQKCGGNWRNSVYKLPEKPPAGRSTGGYSCGDGFKKFKGRCYKVFTEKKSNEEAKTACASIDGRLAAPKTPEIHNFLVGLATELGGQNVWIGLQMGEEETWEYSDGEALGVCSFSNWAPGEPKPGSGANCGQYWAGSGYKWDDTWCTTTNPFICQTGPATCPEGYEKFGDTCYKVYTEKKPYRHARAMCINDGGRLAAPKTTASNNFMVELAKKAGRMNMWIGVNKINTDAYKYSDGTPLKGCKFTNWAPNEPKGAECVQFWAGKSYMWDDSNCSYENSFICQIGPGEDAGCCGAP
ncbi:uncharacterized protein LOC118432265 [Branchiostoma floridae]|uniref:Kringle-containing protein marking the eye and the nose n=2 Tax=Branchiostoma floridae TaxID=7739 RepID=A0A9J7MF90_BRAFL|nr:uncharacterized protein LOC118432265 [Branchiostoma floridae]